MAAYRGRSTWSLGAHLLRLGFFKDFKGADTVLLGADPSGIRSLVAAVSSAASHPTDAVPVHELAIVSIKHPAHLFLGAPAQTQHLASTPTFSLEVSGSAAPQVRELLDPLLGG
jgi:hypothetical protein